MKSHPSPLRLARHARRHLLSATVVWALLLSVGYADANCASPQPRPQDEVWLVSSRSLGCEPEIQVSNLQYWRYDRQLGWVRASLPELLATDSSEVVTNVFVHGNRISWSDAFSNGWNAYQALVRCADERPLRFIIWSWPSEKIVGPIRDARIKASRTNDTGYYLGWFLDQLNPDSPVALWGHSFGARVVTGALHLLGGGTLCGHRLDGRLHPTRQPMQVVLLVAALDNTWLLPGHCHGNAMSQVSRMLLVNNSCDMLLKRYHLLSPGRSNEQALGYTGLVWGTPAEDLARVEQFDACCLVGRHHWFNRYINTPVIMSRIRPYLLYAPSGEALPGGESADLRKALTKVAGGSQAVKLEPVTLSSNGLH